MTITVYTFEDRDGNEYGSFYTQNYEETKQYAMEGKLKVIANNFEFSDSELVDDFTGHSEEDEGDDGQPD